MANNPHFANNSNLYPSYNAAKQVSLGSNSVNETFTGGDTADSFKITSANQGRDTINKFSGHDTLAVDHSLYDGDGDGYIDFGYNNVLDVNRTGGGGGAKAGKYQVAVYGDEKLHTIRYLGTKSGEAVYGAANTRDQLLGHFGKGTDGTDFKGGDASLAGVTHRFESTVNNDTFDASHGATAILVDNATGLNFGSDTVNGFGEDDLLILTADVFKGKTPAIVGFGGNKVLDLSAQSPNSNDSKAGPGGQMDFNGINQDIQSLHFLGQETLGTGLSAVTYYFYGGFGHAAVPGLTTLGTA